MAPLSPLGIGFVPTSVRPELQRSQLRQPIFDFVTGQLAAFELVVGFREHTFVELDPLGDELGMSRVDELEQHVLGICIGAFALIVEDEPFLDLRRG